MLIIYYFIPVVGQEKVGCYGKKETVNCQLSARIFYMIDNQRFTLYHNDKYDSLYHIEAKKEGEIVGASGVYGYFSTKSSSFS